MKIEIEVEDSVYETAASALGETYGITVEQFLANYLTQAIAMIATTPEVAEAFYERIMECPAGDAFMARITRKTSDA